MIKINDDDRHSFYVLCYFVTVNQENVRQRGGVPRESSVGRLFFVPLWSNLAKIDDNSEFILCLCLAFDVGVGIHSKIQQKLRLRAENQESRMRIEDWN